MMDDFVNVMRSSEADIHSEVTSIRLEAQKARATYFERRKNGKDLPLKTQIEDIEDRLGRWHTRPIAKESVVNPVLRERPALQFVDFASGMSSGVGRAVHTTSGTSGCING